MHIDVFQTLADPTRRRIIEALRGGEHAVNDIVARMDIDQSGVSRHLRILNEAGFVQVRPMDRGGSTPCARSPFPSSTPG